MARAARMKRELHMLETEPPAGVSAWPRDESNVFLLDAEVRGADETPYSGGHFKLEVTVPERYPFEPPKVRFMTSIYHPNVDTSGRICLDILNMPPKGGWKPSLNISNVLLSIQLLMSEPNPADPLMADIAQEYSSNRPLFLQKARECTATNASLTQVISASGPKPPAAVTGAADDLVGDSDVPDGPAPKRLKI